MRSRHKRAITEAKLLDAGGVPPANREIAGTEQRIAAAEQGIAGSIGAPSRIDEGAACQAIAAILAVFKPAAASGAMIGPGFALLDLCRYCSSDLR